MSPRARALFVDGAGDERFQGRRIHFVGIGGSGMSGLARMLRQRGAIVGGSDASPGAATAALIGEGIPVTFDQAAGALPEECDLVVASAAIRPDHAELLAAARRGLPAITYAEALGLAQLGRTTICIAGTHGKSTTTALTAHILLSAGLDPSVIVGATCPQLGGGSRTGSATIPAGAIAGRPGLLVCEACEFNRSFLEHHPSLALINNVEEDHLDCFRNIDEIVLAFRDFARLLPEGEPEEGGGRLLIAHEGAHRREICGGLRCTTETFGFNPAADWVVGFEGPDEGRRGIATLRRGSREIGSWSMPVPGEHNALNSAAAAILASWAGAEWQTIIAAIESFRGLERRSQRLGVRSLPNGDAVVYDDYGHHPTEIEATLRALRAVERPRRLICVFQPHQHSRTRFLLDQFAQSFAHADVVIVPQIHFVRDSEAERMRVSAADLVDRLRERGIQAMHLHPFEAIVEQLEVICREGDLVVVMGAGPVNEVAKEFLRPQREVPAAAPVAEIEAAGSKRSERPPASDAAASASRPAAESAPRSGRRRRSGTLFDDLGASGDAR
ncbi:MAG TPA: UDP-N-acetylmuramate--L-alanine ligase [Phycisphaerales bacterium]|nr:UDP-N-acetylmuramate--L-alanine ligase [Phycisphaerales bacterium]HMP38735.1 UDP-N-acetylmuramate--L-alanine ligase [Phycisphaerales bacterium]